MPRRRMPGNRGGGDDRDRDIDRERRDEGPRSRDDEDRGPRDIEPRYEGPRRRDSRDRGPGDIDPRDVDPTYDEPDDILPRRRDSRGFDPMDVERREYELDEGEPRYMERRYIERRGNDPRDLPRRRMSESYSNYLDEAAEDRRDERADRREEREEIRDARRSYYREEAADRRLDRNIRADQYHEFQREEQLEQRHDRRLDRAIGDQVRMERSSRFGGLFATEEDRAFKRIMQKEDREEKLGQYRQLIQQCSNRLQEYQHLEDWLSDVRRANFNADTIARVRTEIRENQREAGNHLAQMRLLNEQTNWNAEERNVLDALDEVNQLEERFYRSVIRACDEENPESLGYALEDLEACRARVSELQTRRIPGLVSDQQNEIDHSDQFGYVAQGAGRTLRKFWLPAIIVGFVGGCGIGFATGGFLNAVTTALILPFLAVPATALVGAVIGFLEWKSDKSVDHFDFTP